MDVLTEKRLQGQKINANKSIDAFSWLSIMLGLDWNTLIVGKLSPWIDADAEIQTERRNSEAVSCLLWTILWRSLSLRLSGMLLLERVLYSPRFWGMSVLIFASVCYLPESESAFLCYPPHSYHSFFLWFSPGSGTGAKLLSLPGSACLHDPTEGPL